LSNNTTIAVENSSSPSYDEANISFLNKPDPKPNASPALWAAAALAFTVLLAFQLSVKIATDHASLASLVGTSIGVLFWPSFAAWFAGRSSAGGTQRAKVKAFLWASVAVLLLGVIAMVVTGAYVSFTHQA
jgi:hypothetical protein